jgi:DNA-binding NarL/FixJ family response regulator
VIRLALVEDHAVLAQGLEALLDDEADIVLVGTATDDTSARELIGRTHPDIVLCDIVLGGERDGLRLLSLARRRGRPRFIMFSAFGRPDYYAQALEGGASGYLMKVVSIEQLTRAIRVVASGGNAFPSAVLRSARAALRRPTERQREVIALVAEGRRNDEIAQRLSIQVKTVEGQLRRLFDRYGVANRTGLVRVAQREGWLPGPDERTGDT